MRPTTHELQLFTRDLAAHYGVRAPQAFVSRVLGYPADLTRLTHTQMVRVLAQAREEHAPEEARLIQQQALTYAAMTRDELHRHAEALLR